MGGTVEAIRGPKTGSRGNSHRHGVRHLVGDIHLQHGRAKQPAHNSTEAACTSYLGGAYGLCLGLTRVQTSAPSLHPLVQSLPTTPSVPHLRPQLSSWSWLVLVLALALPWPACRSCVLLGADEACLQVRDWSSRECKNRSRATTVDAPSCEAGEGPLAGQSQRDQSTRHVDLTRPCWAVALVSKKGSILVLGFPPSPVRCIPYHPACFSASPFKAAKHISILPDCSQASHVIIPSHHTAATAYTPPLLSNHSPSTRHFTLTSLDCRKSGCHRLCPPPSLIFTSPQPIHLTGFSRLSLAGGVRQCDSVLGFEPLPPLTSA